jgi:4-hydroxy-tetrahydrodipicolinate synthase
MRNQFSNAGASLVAIATPFHDNRIDEAALRFLCRRQIEHGTTAIVVCGSTGEASCLTPAEQERAVEVVVEATARHVPVIAGCTSVATATSIQLATAAERAGANGLLCAAPPYNKPTQEGLFCIFGQSRMRPASLSCSTTCRAAPGSKSLTKRSRACSSRS